MSIRVALNHVTSYRYDRAVNLSPQTVRLRPAPHSRTPIASYSLKVSPSKHFINWQQDPFGNFLARLVFPEPTRELRLEVDVVAQLTVINPFDFFLEPDVLKYPFRYTPAQAEELRPYLSAEPVGPQLQKFFCQVPRSADSTVDYLVLLNQLVHQAVKYVIRMEPGVQSCEETLALQTGSCRD